MKGPYTYAECWSCGLVRLDPFPTPEAAAALYGDEYFNDAANSGYDDYVADASIHRRNGRARLKRLGPVPPGGGLLVDIGCAHGFTMVEARDAGWLPVGVDANASARESVRAAGMRCEASLPDLALEPGSVTAVTLFQALEHLPDPIGALRWASSVLEPGGRVLVETWNRRSLLARVLKGRWQVATPPSVLWLFDEASLSTMAEAAGLELVGFRRTTKWVTLGLVVGQMRDRGSASSWMIRLGSRLRRFPLPYFLGDLAMVTLAKPASGPVEHSSTSSDPAKEAMRNSRVRLLPPDALIRTNDLDQADWNYRPVLGTIQRRRFSMVADLLSPQVDSLLEVGYGSGVFMPELAERCSQLFGADSHAKHSEVQSVLERMGITAELVQAPLESLPYPDERFDCVVGVSCLEFVDDIDAACSEVSRVLRPGGSAVFITPGYSPILDLGLRVLSGERAEDTFRGRRQLVLPALRRHFTAQSVVRFPRYGPVWLYTAFAGRKSAGPTAGRSS